MTNIDKSDDDGEIVDGRRALEQVHESVSHIQKRNKRIEK